MKEQEKQKKLLDYLNTIGYAVKVVASKAGEPDIHFCFNGKFIAIEVKKSSKINPSKLQEFKMSKIRQNGGIAFKASSIEEVKQQLALVKNW